jgi:hypothetical protein
MTKERAQRRFIGIPFTSGCRSQSSVDVVNTAPRRAGKKPQGACGPCAACVPIEEFSLSSFFCHRSMYSTLQIDQ